MQVTKIDGKSVLLTPQTAAEECFVFCLLEMIEAREARFLNEYALRLQSLAQDSQPSKEGLQS
jgi:hypothetical protein